MVKRKAQARVSTASEFCVSVITALMTRSITVYVMRGVNSHYGGFLVDSFTPETLINAKVSIEEGSEFFS